MDVELILHTNEIENKIREAIADTIGCDAYDCTRVWSAWSYGTMSPDDFIPIIDQGERITEITNAVIATIISNSK